MKRSNRATPEAKQSQTLASTQAEFLQSWKADQERAISQARDAIARASSVIDNIEKALKELV